MSKTAQRKRNAYQQGLCDGMEGEWFRWSRHPFLDQYRRGFEEGRAIEARREAREAYAKRWYVRFVLWVTRRVAA